MKYYVYGLVDPRDGKIKYIGKGCGNRMFEHVNKAKQNKAVSNNLTKLTQLKEILDLGYEDIAYHRFLETDNQLYAYQKETELIMSCQTLYPNGWNLVSKAIPPGFAGKYHSSEAKASMSLSKIGKTRSIETRVKISEGRTGISVGPMNNQTKEKISKALLGKQFSEEHKRKLSDARKKFFANKEKLENE